MDKKFAPIWAKVEPLMATVKKKDYVLHVKMVVRAMEEILAGEGGDADLLIPAAILHDVGWSAVSEELQVATDKELKNEAAHQHLSKAPPIIRQILSELGYHGEFIEHIVEIVLAHKFADPQEKEKQFLIDADTLSDTYKEPFYSDLKSYGISPREAYRFRSQNVFYTPTAKKIFDRELAARLREIEALEKQG